MGTQPHPDEGVLLALTRHQLRAGSSEGVQQHVAACLPCQMRCAEYMRVSAVLERWATTSPHASPSLANSLLEKIDASERSFVERLRRHLAPTSWRVVSLPIALLLVLLGTAAVIALASGGLRAGGYGHWLPQPDQTGAITYTMQTITQPPTSAAARRQPSIRVCAPPQETGLSHLRICGYDFTPGSQVTLTITFRLGGSKTLPAVSVNGDGMVEEDLSFYDCKNVPLTIVARNTVNEAESSQVLQNIQFSGCAPALSTPSSHSPS